MHAVPCAIRRATFATLLSLPGCASLPTSMNPVDWWHALEGGPIAGQRPPPPKADAPYPNLGSVPARPVPTDTATRSRIGNGLVTDRANARYAAGPSPAGRGGIAPPPATPASTNTPSASLQAATAAPAARPASRLVPPPAWTRPPPPPDDPHPPPRTAAVGGVESAPLAPLLPATPPPAAPVATAAPVDVAALDAAKLTMPAAPPPAPHIEGVAVPAITVPTPPPVAPPAPPPPAKSPTAASLLPFRPDSAEILPEAQDALRALVQRRGAAPVEVTGYGDAASGNPAGQSAALPLAMARARAIAAVLQASGVPSSLVHIQAEAEGHGGAARVVEPGGAAHIAD